VAVATNPTLSAEPRILTAAQRAATRYLTGPLRRTENMPAILDDYAAVATAMLDLYETDFDARWLHRAVELADTMIARFADEQAGGFYMTDGQDPHLIVRPRELYDGAEPSGQSIATLLLLRLADITGTERYRRLAEQTLRTHASWMTRAPHAVPYLLCALDWYLHGATQVFIAGNPQPFLPVLREAYRPRLVIALAEHQPHPRPMLDNQPTAYLCHQFTCRVPTTDPVVLRDQLSEASRTHASGVTSF
ncbi:MAG: thioredoxin domain-containing protein, partial [Verrucomicrobiae bacterium]|nr:thioredoxin domain-containing protein [Verrucomicrobiae bacterium]